MASGEIKQKITLEGEQQYKQALKDAQRNLRTLRSELKAETAEMARNASEQQKAAAKANNRKQQIKEQESVVKTLRAALADAKKEYGDNADVIAKWENKLNDARATLANMQNELAGVGDGFKDIQSGADMAAVATHSVADSLSSLAGIGESISSGIEKAFSGLLTVVRETVGAIWGELMDIAAKSDNYMDLAAYFGSSATEVQKWDSAMKGAGGSLDTVTNLITKLKYSGKNEKIAEWFGVSDENYTNDLQYFQDVMQQMVNMRDEMIKAGTWDDAMAEIFGNKKGFDVEGVLSDWDAIMAGLKNFNADEGGFGLSEKQISDMAELNVQVQTLKESWQKLKEMGTVELFGSLALDLTGNAQGIVDAFLKYFNSDNPEDREAAIAEIETNITAMFDRVKTAINNGITKLGELADELKESDNPTVKALGEALSGLQAALKYLANEDNWGTIEKALAGLITLWAGGKVATAIANIASFASHLKTIGLFGGTKAAEAAASGEAVGTSWGTAFATAVSKAVPWLAGFALLFENAFKEQGNDDLFNEDGTPTELGKELGYTEKQEHYDQGGKPETEEGDGSTFELKFGPVVKSMEEAAEEISEAVTEKEEPKDWRPGYQQLQGSFFNPNMPTIEEAAAQIAEVVEDVLLENEYTQQDKEDAIQDWWDAWREGAEDEGSAFDWMQETLGEDFGAVWDSIMSKLDELGEKQMGMEDLPADWWSNVMNGGNTGGLKSEDLSGFRSLPGQMRAAVASGAATGVSGIRVQMDGATVGRLVAPYVSAIIAADIGG